VARLSELLRISLEIQHQDFMPLTREISILEKYLEIEQLRFSDRLRVEIRVSPETRQALVPSFLLQPLVENALRHGISGQIAGGTVELSARRQGEYLNLQVLDNGAGANNNWQESPGIGLRNTQLRLERLYGGDYRFHAGNRAGGGFAVELAIPFRLEPDEPMRPAGGK
jgi:LytS/YehU family sensor histidine kinase